jgi:hypothetical protein
MAKNIFFAFFLLLQAIPVASRASAEGKGIVVVAGATGGTGRHVVSHLKAGFPGIGCWYMM